jgi:hypothetical protein
MKRRNATILMTVVGVLVFLCVVGASLGWWFFASAVDSETADEPAATLSFDEVRRRFPGQQPALDVLDDHKVVVRRDPPGGAPAGSVQRLQLLTWDPADQDLSRITLPFWLLRMKPDSARVTVNHRELDITVEQLERYGPTLLVDHESQSGDRLLIWTE